MSKEGPILTKKQVLETIATVLFILNFIMVLLQTMQGMLSSTNVALFSTGTVSYVTARLPD